MDIPSYLLGKKAGGGSGGALEPIVVEELPQTGQSGKLYLVPRQTTETNNVFDEYIYVNDAWELIGTAEIDLFGKQDLITSTNKLDASLVDDSLSTNKFVTSTEKTTWNGKQDLLTAGDNITIENNVISASGGSDIPIIEASSNMDWYGWRGNYVTSSDPNYSKWQDYVDLLLERKSAGKSYPLLYYTKHYDDTGSDNNYGQSVLFTPYKISYQGIVLYGTPIHTASMSSSSFDSYGNITSSQKTKLADQTNFYIPMIYIVFQSTSNTTIKAVVPYHLGDNWATIDTAQTISAKKTFSTLPESSVTPTTNNQLVNKKYVDDSVAGIDLSSKQDTMQYSTMPTATSETVGKIVQYTGTTDSTYTNGYFYIGTSATENDVTTYSWENLNVQDGGSETKVIILDYQSNAGTLQENLAKAKEIYNDQLNGKTDLIYVRDDRAIYQMIYQPYSNGNGFNLSYNFINTQLGNIRIYGLNLYKTSYFSATYFNGNPNDFVINKGVNGYIFVGETNTLPLGMQNTTAYTPTSNYNPATKKYVDDSISTAVGNINTVLATLTTPSGNGGN